MSWEHHHNLHFFRWNNDQACSICPRERKETYHCSACNYDECIRCFREGKSSEANTTIMTHHHRLHDMHVPPNAQCDNCLVYNEDNWDDADFHACTHCDYAECGYCHREYEHVFVDVFDYAELDFSGCTTLGEGAFGQVRTAILDDQVVAVKTLKPRLSSLMQDFRDEAQLLTIQHANIVRLIGVTESPPAIVTERLFCSLNKYAVDKLDNDQVMHICCDVIDALTHLHYNNVVHRDVKPANILVTEDASVAKIADFGLATIVDRELDARDRQEIYRTQCGTEQFMAPEVFTGHYDAKVDVYSVGVLISNYVAQRHLTIKQRQTITAALQHDPDLRPTMREMQNIFC